MYNNNLIELFVDNFKGAACIRPLDEDFILFSKNICKLMINNVQSISESINLVKTPLEESSISFFDFVDGQFKRTQEPTFSCGIFNGIEYTTMRITIEYNKKLCILTLLTSCDECPSEEPTNDLYICNTKGQLN